jgi:RIO kinase 1
VTDVEEAEELLEQLLRTVERMLFRDVVHGDLSPYNVLVWDGEVTVIDFPQAVDAKKNRHARALLERDVRRIGEHFERLGVVRPWDELAADLWTAWELADLVPEELRGLTT